MLSEIIARLTKEPWMSVDAGLHIRFVNEAWTALFLSESKDVLGQHVTDELLHAMPGKLTKWLESLFTNSSEEHSKIFDFIHSGVKEKMEVRVTKVGFADAVDKRQVLLSFQEPVKFQKEKKNTQTNRIQLSEFLNTDAVLIAIVEGKDFILTTANDAILDQLGRDRSIIGKPYFTSVPELVDQGFKEIMEMTYEADETYHANEQLVILRRHGRLEKRYFNFSFSPLHDAKCRVKGISIIAFEVTPQVHEHEAIRDNEQRYHTIAELMPAKVFTMDRNKNYLFFNESWTTYTGREKSELLEAGWEDLIHPDDIAKFEKINEPGYDIDTGADIELRIQNRCGKYLWHLCRFAAVKNQDVQSDILICSLTRIQEMKEEERRKLDFLKIASHELKTPVTSVKGYVQMLLSLLEEPGPMSIESLPLKKTLERIHDQIDRLTNLIVDLLDVSRFQEGALGLRKSRFDLKDMLARTVQDLAFSHPEADIKLQCAFDGDVYADTDRLSQVVINLVANAIKYSRNDKRVEITAELIRSDWVQIGVRDFGIGISQAHQDLIFNRFFRVNNDHETSNYSGFGIGLYLVKMIVEKHGGKIGLESTPGVGSLFTFEFPIGIYQKKNESEKADIGSRG